MEYGWILEKFPQWLSGHGRASFKDVQSFRGFANFYQRLIGDFEKHA